MAQPILYRALVGTGFVGLVGANLSGLGKVCDATYEVGKNAFGLFFDQFRDDSKSTPLAQRISIVKKELWSCVYVEQKDQNNKVVKAKGLAEHAERFIASPIVKVACAIAMIPLLEKFGGPFPSSINNFLGIFNVQILKGPLSAFVNTNLR